MSQHTVITNATDDDDLSKVVVGQDQHFSVDAMRGAAPFFSLNAQGKREEIGRIVKTTYDKTRALQTLTFIPQQKTDRPYPLGIARGSFQPINHADILEPLIDLGFTFSQRSDLRGGVKEAAILSYPGITVEDPIDWDLQQFTEKPAKRTITFSLGLWLDARPLHGFHSVAGFFRRVCLNGMVSGVLGLGELRVPHRGFSIQKIVDFAKRTLDENGKANGHFPTCTTRALPWMIRTLTAAMDDPSTIGNFPKVVSDPLTQLIKIFPDKVMLGLTSQLDVLRTKEKEFSVFDLLNAVTNAEKESKGAGLVMKRERIMDAMMSMAEIAALKCDTRFK